LDLPTEELGIVRARDTSRFFERADLDLRLLRDDENVATSANVSRANFC